MANITRFEPVTDLLRLDPFRDFEDMLKAWRMRPLFAEAAAGMPEFKMDLKEDEKAYYLKADLPGMKKEEIKVTVDGNLVTIVAETKAEKEEKGKASLYTERTYGRQVRSFTVRHDVDEAKAEATYKDGVLELTLPKKEVAPVREVAVH